MNGSKAEIHLQWNLKNWYNITPQASELLTKNFPGSSKRIIDLYISSPYSIRWEGDFNFDIMAEFKMYRGGSPYYPWEDLKPQLETLLQAKKISMTKVAVAFMLNRGGLDNRKWQKLLSETSKFKTQGVQVCTYDAGHLP